MLVKACAGQERNEYPRSSFSKIHLFRSYFFLLGRYHSRGSESDEVDTGLVANWPDPNVSA